VPFLGYLPLLYFIEGTNPQFENIPVAVLWSTLTIFGGSIEFGQLSMPAKIVVVFLQFFSLLLFGLMVHIIGRIFEYKLLGSNALVK